MLTEKTEVVVRFNEADPLGVVWHGHYLRYFEDGREAFGKRYGLSYLDCSKQGMAVPIVSIQCDYKKPLKYGDSVIVITTFMNDPAAKIKFEYQVVEKTTGAIVAVGKSVQVFVDIKTFSLQLLSPPFYESWKQKWNLLL